MLKPVAEDRRDSKRNRMLKGGVIAFSARHATLPCVLRDLSDTGARLQVAQGSSVPDTFELLVELDGLEAHCQVAWRKPTEIGVMFLEAPRIGNPKRVQIVGVNGPQAKSTLRRGSIVQAPPASPTSAPAEMLAPAVPTPPVTPVVPVAPLAPAATRAASVPSVKVAATRASIPILIAEDDPDDRLLMQEAFRESAFTHPLAFVQNGEELLRYVRGETPYVGREFPGLILLDLNMPKMDGRTALMHLKTDAAFKRIPVIVLTTSNAEEDIQRTYELGVTAFISKPGSFEGLMQLVASLNGFFTRFVHLPTPAA